MAVLGVGTQAIHVASAIVGILTVPATYLVADALLWRAQTADIAMHNSGGFRWKRVFPAGDITRADVHELLPFQNSLVVAEFDSRELAIAWASEDPYVAAGVYAKVTVKPFKRVLP